ncbi:hypothetical protein QQF64_026139, partial [Cirrhinus molitorella]
ISGVNDVHVFISSGENVHLPCNNALHDCNSTTWTYNRFRLSSEIKLTDLGIKKNDTESHERLSLGSDCSLNIKNITKEDYGYYSCLQYVNGHYNEGENAHIHLHVLHVSSSSSQTEISAGSSVSLSCQIYSYLFTGVSCDDWINSQGINLFWVNQTGDKLKISDSGYNISTSRLCIITLNTTLLNEDDNREWRCEVNQGDQVKTSVTYTVKISGISGVDDVHVFISSGENVHLPCNNALHDCRSTTWNYNRFSNSSAVELINSGIKKKDTESHERLSLGSDCSLNIKNITKEDYGFYICRQYVNEQQQGDDARVYLHVLHVSSSSSQTEISAGSTYTVKISAQDKTTTAVNPVHITNPKNPSTTKSPQTKAQADSSTAVTPVHITNSQNHRETQPAVSSSPLVISVSAAAFAVFLVVVFCLIWRKRAGNKRGTDGSSVKDENEDKGTYETINMSIPAAARDNEQTDDVTYSEVSSSGKKPVKSLTDHNDSVTYAAIRGTENDPRVELYSSVNKNKSSTNKH